VSELGRGRSFFLGEIRCLKVGSRERLKATTPGRKKKNSLLPRTEGYLRKGGAPVPPDLSENVRSSGILELREKGEMEKPQKLTSWNIPYK
jgi:hypothetical protein